MTTTDARLVLRQIGSARGTGVLIVLTLAFGIGITTAAFSIVHGAVLKPLGYREPARLVAVHAAFLRAGLEGMGLSGPEAAELAQFDSGLTSVGAFAFRGGATVQAREPVQATMAFATASLLTTLGVDPIRGRRFDGDEPGNGILLLHPFWLRAFGADPAVVGTTIAINGAPREVLGVMPAGFDLLDLEVDIIAPLPRQDLTSAGRTNHSYTVIGRLAPGLEVAGAQARIDAVVQGWLERLPSAHAPNPAMHPLRLVPLHTVVTGSARPLLLTLMGAVGLVMLIACVNVANLLLARAERQRHDTAVHLALGAPRSRLMQRWLLEGGAWALCSAALGTLLAWTLVRTVVAMEPEGIPRLAGVGLDRTVLLFTAGIAAATGIVFGLLPGMRLAASRPAHALGGGRSGSTGTGRQVLRQTLIGAEVALAVVLLAGSALMIRSFSRLTQVQPGFETSGVWRMSATYPARLFPTTAHFHAALDDLRGRLSAAPAVISVGMMQGLPPRREPSRSSYRVEGTQVDPRVGAPLVDFVQICDAGFFSTLGVGLVEGRLLSETDSATSAPVVVINESLARRFFPGESAVGRRITAGGPPAQARPWMTVVGVVADMRQGGLQSAPGTEVFVPITQAEATIGYLPRSMNVVVKAAAGSGDIPTLMRGALRASAPDVPALGLRPMDDVVSRTIAHPRFLAVLLASFGVGALLLAVTGIYSVVSYLVGLRTREIGIRVALGSSSAGVRRLVLGQTLWVTCAGIGGGLAIAHWSGRLLSNVLFEVSAGDVATNLAGAGVLAVSALLAADIPARRAARVDPVQALRAD